MRSTINDMMKNIGDILYMAGERIVLWLLVNVGTGIASIMLSFIVASIFEMYEIDNISTALIFMSFITCVTTLTDIRAFKRSKLNEFSRHIGDDVDAQQFFTSCSKRTSTFSGLLWVSTIILIISYIGIYILMNVYIQRTPLTPNVVTVTFGVILGVVVIGTLVFQSLVAIDEYDIERYVRAQRSTAKLSNFTAGTPIPNP